MHLSLNEVETAVRRAAVGAGLASGLAVETGRAATWLCARELNGLEAVLAALDPPLDPKVPTPPPLETESGWVFPHARTAAAGPAALDLLMAGDVLGGVELTDADAPWLLVGLAGTMVGPSTPAIELDFASFGSVRVWAGGMRTQGAIPTTSATVRLTCVDPAMEHKAQTLRTADGVDADPEAWGRIQALAALTYVPSDPLSRARGAGAGSIDNE